MTETHYRYRPILPHPLYMELVGDETQGQEVVRERYNEYLAQNQTVTGVAWTVAELVWHEQGAKTIQIDPRTALDLMIASASVDIELPPLPDRECQAICYEFPLTPRLSLAGLTLAALLAVHAKNDIIVWLAECHRTRGEILESGKLREMANEPLSLPENLIEVGLPTDQMVKLENRRMAIIAYHLCRGLDWFADHVARHTRVLSDGSVKWLDQPEK